LRKEEETKISNSECSKRIDGKSLGDNVNDVETNRLWREEEKGDERDIQRKKMKE
jgi:hypothetical protein